jgi:hypothetical protein
MRLAVGVLILSACVSCAAPLVQDDAADRLLQRGQAQVAEASRGTDMEARKRLYVGLGDLQQILDRYSGSTATVPARAILRENESFFRAEREARRRVPAWLERVDRSPISEADALLTEAEGLLIQFAETSFEDALRRARERLLHWSDAGGPDADELMDFRRRMQAEKLMLEEHRYGEIVTYWASFLEGVKDPIFERKAQARVDRAQQLSETFVRERWRELERFPAERRAEGIRQIAECVRGTRGETILNSLISD